MRRTLAFVPFAAVVVGLIVTALSSLRRWGWTGRGVPWSKDPAIFNEQLVFVVVAGTLPLVFFLLARFLDSPRDNGTNPHYDEKLPLGYEDSIKRS